MRSANPVLSDERFSVARGNYFASTQAMTMQGTVIKTAILLLLAFISAAWIWTKFYKSGSNAEVVVPWMTGGAIAGFILAMVTAFKPTWSAVASPLYALCEGVFIGAISALMEAKFPGIVIQAVVLTFGTLLAMLVAYQSGLIRATEKFKLGVFAATGAIALVYIVTMVLSLFHINVPFIFGDGWSGIAFSLFVVVIAALNFVIDFDFIEQGARRGLPRYMEWYGAFALMVTLVWLYVEFLRLLSKLRER